MPCMLALGISDTARQSDPGLIGGFARDGRYGQEQACKKPVKTRGRNSEYNIGPESHQNVAKQKAQHHSSAGLGLAGFGGAIGERGDYPLQPVKIQISDGASASESQATRQP